jgi:hypothetical protein
VLTPSFLAGREISLYFEISSCHKEYHMALGVHCMDISQSVSAVLGYPFGIELRLACRPSMMNPFANLMSETVGIAFSSRGMHRDFKTQIIASSETAGFVFSTNHDCFHLRK